MAEKITRLVEIDREEPYFISAGEHKGKPTFTVRHTWYPPDSETPVPTKKGITIDLREVPELVGQMLAVYNEAMHENWELSKTKTPTPKPEAPEPQETHKG